MWYDLVYIRIDICLFKYMQVYVYVRLCMFMCCHADIIKPKVIKSGECICGWKTKLMQYHSELVIQQRHSKERIGSSV